MTLIAEILTAHHIGKYVLNYHFNNIYPKSTPTNTHSPVCTNMNEVKDDRKEVL